MGFGMHLVFGVSCDGRTFPDAPDPVGVVDAAVVGPAGLVDALELQLGLSAPPMAGAIRIAGFLAKLRAAGDDRFWVRSFQKDPWATAATLLDWRDELVAGGWRGAPVGVRRIDDLAAAEASGDPLERGLADRASALIQALPTRPGLRLARLTLVESRDALPSVFRRLVDAIEVAGVHVETHDGRVAAAQGTDLARVQASIAGSAVGPLEGDGSFCVVEADTALMAAEAVADWLACEPESDVVILAPDGDTALLDHALGARGLPALGLSRPSPWRGALQVLPLAFACAWRPLDATALLNLLMLPRPPLARFAAGMLSRALTAEPGLGGAAWEQAWRDIRAKSVEKSAETDAAAATRKADEQVGKWRAWMESDACERSVGMTAEAARRIAGRVEAWALGVDAGERDPLLLAVAGAASALSQAVDRLQEAILPPLLIERILAQVLAQGIIDPLRQPDAGALRAVRAPGALWSSARRVVWWNFVGPGDRIASSPWSVAEKTALEAGGVVIEPAADIARRATASYNAVVQHASQQLILVRPALAGDGPTVVHPLAHQLQPLLATARPAVFFRAERLLREPNAGFAGRIVRRDRAEPLEPPIGRTLWSAPAAAIGRMEGRRESASSLQRLFACQFGWFAQDVLGLRPGRFAQIPSADQLFGMLAHEIARRLLPPGDPPPLSGVRAAATALFEQLVPQMAAPLQQPQHAAELVAARQLVPDAIEALVRLLHERGLQVVGAELEREAQERGLPLQGRLDLLVRRGARVAVLDMKWTRSERRYREEVSEGRALQLAVYRAVSAADGDPSPGAYFLLRQQRVIAGTGSILTDDPLEVVRSEGETLAALSGDWSVWTALAKAGTLVAAGVGDAALHRPEELRLAASKEPCLYCDLTALCRIHAESM